MSYTVEEATKTTSNVSKLEQQTKNRFQTKLRLKNNFFVRNLQENL